MTIKVKLNKLYKQYEKLEDKLGVLNDKIYELEQLSRKNVIVKAYKNSYSFVSKNGKKAKLVRDARSGALTLVYNGKERGTYFNVNDARTSFGAMV